MDGRTKVGKGVRFCYTVREVGGVYEDEADCIDRVLHRSAGNGRMQ